MYKFIFKTYFIWLVVLISTLFVSTRIVKLQPNFLGGGISNYLDNPILWSFANFDGEHYLAIAKDGYKPLTHFFFPIYPLLIRIFGGSILSAIFISHISLILSLFGLYKLIKLDYSDKIAKLAIVLMMAFPTSFYFGAVYTESVFLSLVVWSFYFFKVKKYLLSGLIGAFVSATRLIGILLLPSFVTQYKKIGLQKFLLLIPTGLAAYMFYLYKTTGDWLAFFSNVSIFGAQRSSTLIMLPQVFYRYIFKIIPNLNFNYFPTTYTTFLELSVALVFLLLIIYSFKKISYDYWIYMTLGYLVPTLSGSFSSLPRYVLVLFPTFILTAVFLERRKYSKFFLISLMIIMATISLSMFARGYWIS